MQVFDPSRLEPVVLLIAEQPDVTARWRSLAQSASGPSPPVRDWPCCIILDWGLPGSAGLLSTIVRVCDVPVIAFGPEPDAALDALQLGAQDFLDACHTAPKAFSRAVSYAIARAAAHTRRGGCASGLEFVHPEDRERLRNAADSRDAVPCRIRDAAGVYHPILISAIPLPERLAGPHSEPLSTEAVLRRSEERLRAALEASRTGTFRWDIATGELDWDEGLRAIYHVPPDKPVRTLDDFLSRVHPDDRERIIASASRAFKEGGEFANDLRILLPDGSVRWLHDRSRTYPGPDGRPAYVTGACTDITERKQAEAAVARSEALYRSLADEMPQIVFSTNAAWDCDFVSRRWVEYTGLSPEAAVGAGWQDAIHPGDRPAVFTEAVRARAAGDRFEVRYRLRRSDGDYRWHLSRGYPVRDDQGRPRRWIGTLTDIHEMLQTKQYLREREEVFRKLYSSGVVGIASGDAEGVLDANEVYLQTMGYSRDNLSAGRIDWAQLAPPGRLEQIRKRFRALRAAASVPPLEVDLLRKDGSTVSLLVGVIVLRREPFSWLAFVVDLTERKALERKLLEKHKLESIGLLAAGIAHEFNNLLTSILGNAILVRDVAAWRPPVKESLDDVIQAAERASKLTRELLAYSGKGAYFFDRLDLAVLVEEVAGIVRPSAGGVPILIQRTSALPLLEGDPLQLRQLITNLVLNAVESIGNGEGSVTVRTGCRHIDQHFLREVLEGAEIEPGRYVFVEVRDSGCGMTHDLRRQIFDPFFTTKFLGRGLGLAAVAGIVRGHKGAVQVLSEPGVGSTFCVYFPAPQGPAPIPEI